MVKIKKVQSKKEWKQFLKLPYKIYEGNKYWIPPLEKEILLKLDINSHPFWEHAKREVFIAEKDGKIAGRIVAVIDDNYNQLWKEKMGAFGFFECINDSEVARELFSTAYKWLADNGADTMRGPLSPSQNDECGFLINSYDSSPVIMMPYNPPYYIELTEKYGFKKAKDLLAFYKSHADKPTKQIENAVKRLKANPKITTRHVNMKKLDEEKKIIKELYNQSWQQNWGFSPMSDKEFELLVKDIKKFADPYLIWFAFYDNEPAGVSITLPNINLILKKINGKLGLIGLLKFLYYRNKINGTRALVFGFKHKYRRLGLPALLYHETEKAGLKRGYEWCELSWNLEDNKLINQFDEKVGARLYKKYRIYELPIK